MKKYSSLLLALLSLSSFSLHAQETEQEVSSKPKQPRYIISMKVEEIGETELDTKIIASSVFECEEGIPAKLSIGSSDPEQSLNKLIDIEACINSED